MINVYKARNDAVLVDCRCHVCHMQQLQICWNVYGRRISEAIDCDGVMCIDGVCVLLDGARRCICPDDFEFCQLVRHDGVVDDDVGVDVCRRTPCLNNGTCRQSLVDVRQVTCLCADGFTGYYELRLRST